MYLPAAARGAKVRAYLNGHGNGQEVDVIIGVPKETGALESRVAATPETVKKLVAQGHRVLVETGAGAEAFFTDDAYVAAGAEITEATRALNADVVLKV
jgi:NAD(P) transhydrogenase subunit alpha